MSIAEAPPPNALALDVVPNRREVIVAAGGVLDLVTSDALAEAVADLRASGFDEVVVDLREVEFMDSTGLRALLVLRNDFARAGARLTLIPARPQAQRIFELTRTAGLFDWRPHL